MKKIKEKSEVLCKITKDENSAFEKLRDIRLACQDILADTQAQARHLWKAMRVKYNLGDDKNLKCKLDHDTREVRKIF